MKVYQKLASLIVAYQNCVKTNNEEWKANHWNSICEINDRYLPSGSGVDNGTQINVRDSTSKRIILQTAFHHMDEHGGYDGWTEHIITVTADMVGGVSIKVHGRNRNDIKAYLSELYYNALAFDTPDTAGITPEPEQWEYAARDRMEATGGHFATNLAKAWGRADSGNLRLLRKNFMGLLRMFKED